MTSKIILIGLLTLGLACSASGLALAADAIAVDSKDDKACDAHKHHKSHKHNKNGHKKADYKHKHKKNNANHHQTEKRVESNSVYSNTNNDEVVSGSPPASFEGKRESEEGQMADRNYRN